MRRLVFLAAGMFAMGCDDYVIAGLLPGISASLGISYVNAIEGVAAFGITFVASAPICAILLARKPARRVLVLSLTVFALGNLMTLLSASLAAYVLSRAIAGLGAGLFLPVAVATATQLVEPERRGRALSLIWGSNSAGAVIGVPLGLGLAEKWGWRATIGLILLLGLVSLAGLAIQKLDPRLERPPSFKQQLRLLVDRRVLSVIGVTAITAAASLGLYAYVAPLLDGSANSSMSALSLWNVGGLIGTTAIGIVVDRTGKPKRVMAGVLVSLLIAIASIPVLSSVSVLGLLPFLLWGAMGWATVTPQQCALIELQPQQEATLVALNSSAVSLGSVAGASLGGFAISCGMGVRALPYAAAALLVGALGWQLLLIQKRRQEVLA